MHASAGEEEQSKGQRETESETAELITQSVIKGLKLASLIAHLVSPW